MSRSPSAATVPGRMRKVQGRRGRVRALHLMFETSFRHYRWSLCRRAHDAYTRAKHGDRPNENQRFVF